MAYQKINRRRKYTKKKRYPLATAFITIIFCIGLSLGLAALWQNHSKNLTESSESKSSMAEPLSSSQPQSQSESSAPDSSSSDAVSSDEKFCTVKIRGVDWNQLDLARPLPQL